MIDFIGWITVIWFSCSAVAWLIDLTKNRLDDTAPREYLWGPLKLYEILKHG